MTSPPDLPPDATTVPVDASAPAPVNRRLGDAVADLRRRAGTVPLERWLLLAGSVLVPLGVVMILLAWYGTAHTTRVYEQIPYAVSGGLLGLAFVFGGGFAYFAYWITKLIQEERARADRDAELAERTTEALDRIEAALRGEAPPATRARLVVTARGTLVHRPDCPAVTDRGDVRAVNGEAGRYGACKICEPELPDGRRRTRRRSGR